MLVWLEVTEKLEGEPKDKVKFKDVASDPLGVTVIEDAGTAVAPPVRIAIGREVAELHVADGAGGA